MTRALDHGLYFVEIAAGFLDGDDVGMGRQFDDDVGGHVVSRSLRKIVDDDRQRGAVGNGAIKGEQVRRMHLLFVVVRSAHHGAIVSEFGGVLGEVKGLVRRLAASAGNHDFIGSGGCQRCFQHIAPFLIGEKDGFASRSLHHNASDRRTRVAFSIRFDLFVVNLAIGIKRRGNGRENSGQKHVSSRFSSVSHLTFYSFLLFVILRGTFSRQSGSQKDQEYDASVDDHREGYKPN